MHVGPFAVGVPDAANPTPNPTLTLTLTPSINPDPNPNPNPTSRRESSSWAAQRRGSSASEVLIRVRVAASQADRLLTNDDAGDHPCPVPVCITVGCLCKKSSSDIQFTLLRGHLDPTTRYSQKGK